MKEKAQEQEDKKKMEASVKTNFHQTFLPVFDESISTNYYHMIVNIDCFSNLIKGWEIKYSAEGHDQYEKQKDKKSCVIGVVGNSNKGKSFILQQFTGVQLPNGYSIKTEGLSLKYPVIELQNVILLDSAGLENPLRNLSGTDMLASVDKKDEAERLLNIRNLARDKQLTELFIQTFMIAYSDILILVLGVLTYSDQILLNRIKNDLKKGSTLFVVHNLSPFVSIPQVKSYIDNVLNESLTFSFETQIMQNLELNSNQNQKINSHYYIEKSDKHIIHLIMANEYSEAGEYYNSATITFLKNQCVSFTNIKPFPVIERIKEHLILMSKKFFEKPIDESELGVEKKRLKLLTGRESIDLKKCLVDELGFSNFYGSSITPKYFYYTENEYLVVGFDLVGKIEHIKVVMTIKNLNNICLVTGVKFSEVSDLSKRSQYKSNRNFGHIFLEILIPVEKVKLQSTKIVKKEKVNGQIKLFFLIQKKEEGEGSEEQTVTFE